jgi:hypothetical protein
LVADISAAATPAGSVTGVFDWPSPNHAAPINDAASAPVKAPAIAPRHQPRDFGAEGDGAGGIDGA